MNARRLVLVVLASLCTMAGGLLFVGGAAQAELTHSFVGSFGVAGPGSGAFSMPLGVAVDQSTGDVYVYDSKSGVPSIYKFNAAGEPQDFSALGTNVIEGSGEAYFGYSQIAVDSSGGPTGGDIYAVEGEHVTVYGADGDRLGELNREVEADGGPWGFTCGVAVDPTGNVYVGLYERHVNKYTPTSNPVGNSDYVSSLAGLPEGSCNLAADSEGNVYVTSEEGRGPVSKYEALQFGSLSASGTAVDDHGKAVAVDPAGSDDDLYVDEGSDVAQYDSSASLLGKFGASGAGALSGYSTGVAVNHSSGQAYVTDPEEYEDKGAVNIYNPGTVVPDVSTEPVSALLASSVTLNGTVNPDNEGDATCEFQYATNESYEATGSYDQIVPCSTSVPSGSSPVPITADVSGLVPNTTYHYRLDATNTNGVNDSEDATFTTTGSPTILSESGEATGHYSVRIEAQVNPGGLQTSYHFEYGPSTSYGTSTPVPDGTIPAGFTAEGVSVELTGLAIGQSYHYRLVATNANSPTPVYGPDETVTTIPPALIEEERVSEVTGDSVTLSAGITPLEGNDTRYYFQYGTSSCAASPSSCADAPSLPGTDIGSEEVFRTASTHIQNLTADTIYHYRAVATNVLGFAYGTEQTFKTQSAGGELVLPDGRVWELVSPPNKQGATIEPINASTEGEGGVIEAAEKGDAITYVADGPIGEAEGNSAPDLDQIFSARGSEGWSSQSITTPTASPTGVSLGEGSEYQWFSSDLSLGLMEPPTATPLSSETSEGTVYLRDDTSGRYLPLVTAANIPFDTELNKESNKFGRPYNVYAEGASPDLTHVVLDSTAKLTSNAVKNGDISNLYEWTGGQLQLVSVLPNGEPADAEGEPAFLGSNEIEVSDSSFNRIGRVRHAVSENGSRVVWNTGGGGAQHLYMRDTARGETVQLDAAQGASEPTGGGEAMFQIANSDGSKVFFSDGQKLTANSTANGRFQPNLYVFEVTSRSGEPLAGKLTDLTVVGDASTRVAGISEDGSYVYAGNFLHYNGTEWIGTPIPASISGLEGSSRVSPNGRYFAFEGEHSEQVELYDASTDRVACVSCNPTGETEGSDRLPEWTRNGVTRAVYQSRYLSDSGRLFFQSGAALVPQDTNGQGDVYEYEPQGVGSCESSSTTFDEASGGCVGLISSGSSSERSTFLDASENGDDVFFLEDGDVYDAHVCSAAAPCLTTPVAPPACTTADSCRAAPSLQPTIFGASGSATFSGAGNIAPAAGKSVTKTKAKPLTRAQRLAKALKECKQNRQKRERAVCEAWARKRYEVRAKAKKPKASKSLSVEARR